MHTGLESSMLRKRQKSTWRKCTLALFPRNSCASSAPRWKFERSWWSWWYRNVKWLNHGIVHPNIFWPKYILKFTALIFMLQALIFINVIVYIVDCVLSFRTGISMLWCFLFIFNYLSTNFVSFYCCGAIYCDHPFSLPYIPVFSFRHCHYCRDKWFGMQAILISWKGI